MKPGDFLLLQMGHNDPGDLDGAKPRGSLKGIGTEARDLPQTAGPFSGRTETVRTYGSYMRQMIDEARAKGVHVTLLTLTVRNIWTNGRIERDMGFTGYIRALAAQEHVPLADLSTAEADILEEKGEAPTAALFPKDHTHTSAIGADLVAHAVITALEQIHSPLLAYSAGR
jgi:lysophospholipase L1-like esterase